MSLLKENMKSNQVAIDPECAGIEGVTYDSQFNCKTYIHY